MKYHTWTNQDISFLVSSYERLEWKEISQHIGVSVDAVKRKAYELNLKKPIIQIKRKVDETDFKLKHESIESIYDCKPVFCRPISIERCTPIKVDGATIWVKPGKDPEIVRQRFENRMR